MSRRPGPAASTWFQSLKLGLFIPTLVGFALPSAFAQEIKPTSKAQSLIDLDSTNPLRLVQNSCGPSQVDLLTIARGIHHGLSELRSIQGLEPLTDPDTEERELAEIVDDSRRTLAIAESQKEQARALLITIQEMSDELIELRKSRAAELFSKFGFEVGRSKLEEITESEDPKIKLMVKRPGVGRAEFNTIDGQPTIRFVHTPSRLSIKIAAQDLVGSSHMEQWGARQHIVAGHETLLLENDAGAPIKAKMAGRSYVLIGVDSLDVETGFDLDKIQSARFYPKPSTRSERWARWKRAMLQAPTKGDWVYTLGFNVPMQSALLLGILAVSQQFDPDVRLNVFPFVVNTALALLFGVYNSSLRNIIEEGGPQSKLIKRMGISFVTTLLYVVSTKGMAGFVGRDMIDTVMLWANMVFVNTFLNNRIKLAWDEKIEIRT